MSSSPKLLEKGIETRNDPYPTRNALQVRVRHFAFYRAIQNYISIGFVKYRQVKISDSRRTMFRWQVQVQVQMETNRQKIYSRLTYFLMKYAISIKLIVFKPLFATNVEHLQPIPAPKENATIRIVLPSKSRIRLIVRWNTWAWRATKSFNLYLSVNKIQREIKMFILNQERGRVCDASYVGYALRHLHQLPS